MQYDINSICIFEGWFCTVLSRFFPFLIAGSYRGIRNVKYVKRDGKLYTYFNYFLLGPQYSSSNMKKMERIWKCRVSWIYHFNICQNENTNLVAATMYYTYRGSPHFVISQFVIPAISWFSFSENQLKKWTLEKILRYGFCLYSFLYGF